MDGWSEESIREVLARAELFQPVPPEELAGLGRCAAVRRFRPGEVVFREGERADSFYVIASGSVAVRVNGPADRPISILEAGDFFGEIALITGARRTAAVTVETDATLVELPGAEILALATRCLPFRVRLGKVGTTRSRGSLASRLSQSRPPSRGT